MQSAQPVANPFALLLNPAAVVEEMERSERLNRLSSRICRPLDRVQPANGSADAAPDDADLVVAPELENRRFG
ncbi:hypothetical protein [Variovorax sp. YR752]|uniref:hypothetical protein n=1 Tax=Variovorax sp. YR752 TaxID=1884383 RepID=UPI0031380D19